MLHEENGFNEAYQKIKYFLENISKMLATVDETSENLEIVKSYVKEIIDQLEVIKELVTKNDHEDLIYGLTTDLFGIVKVLTLLIDDLQNKLPSDYANSYPTSTKLVVIKAVDNFFNNTVLPTLRDIINVIYILKAKIYDSINENQSIKLKESISNNQSVSRALNGAKTEEIYEKSYLNHRKIAIFYDVLFFGIICFAIYFYIYIDYLNIHFPYDSNEVIKSILPRLFLASNFVLIITFCLRRSAHHRKISQQAQQTSLELQALPLFVKELRDDDKLDLYRELAGKYFGKTLDQTQNDKVGDLIQDQAKMSIDIAKATTEMVKSLKDVKSDKDSKKDDSK